MTLPADRVIPLPSTDASMLPLMTSGLTASIALEEIGQIKSGETLLVTAAAGATGSFAVQLGKIHGMHVIGTCSSDEKAEYLRSIGCDRPINYKKEDLFDVLRSEYPKGINVVYESVGGETFMTCVNNLSVGGRLIIIGSISGYETGSSWAKSDSAASTPLSVNIYYMCMTSWQIIAYSCSNILLGYFYIE